MKTSAAQTETEPTRFDRIVADFATAADNGQWMQIRGRCYSVSRNWDGDNRYWTLTASDWSAKHMIRVAVDGSFRDAATLMPVVWN